MSVVDIAMATYNGEKYLREQIDSIISQTFTDWRLFIRDDGSIDKTIDIIREYVEKDSRIHLIEDGLGNLHVSKNFEQALLYCTAPYSMFADQDDVWFDNKIEVSVSFMKRVEKEGVPVLMFSNSVLVSESLDVKFENNYNLKKDPELRNFLFANAGYQGSTMVFNNNLKEKLFPFFPNSSVHDYHVSIAALLFGEVYHVNEPLMLYRRHDSATTKKNISLIERMVWLFKNKSFLSDKKMLSYLKEFTSYHEDEITETNRNLINDYFKILDKKTFFLKKAKLVLKNNFSLRDSKHYLIFKLLVLK
ncbi:glycosyltransferase family 2 protein [Flavobacterium sp. N2038]|uniref:glycosyltransferase family 2 protein n=1 Tax=Flavobacterium sp. N2038 TaxID=2986829 RepID=UPI0022247D1C|nr:glycosyltransferase family 2 protein [Flavobacterium sp. N2038]